MSFLKCRICIVGHASRIRERVFSFWCKRHKLSEYREACPTNRKDRDDANRERFVTHEKRTFSRETLYLAGVPGMRESIVEGINTLIEECDAELDW